MRALALALFGLWAGASAGEVPWAFQPAEEVSPIQGPRVFHHLESAGRRNIAVSAGSVGVAWEDNRSGAPQVYAALRTPGASAFATAVRLSEGTEAYEPAIVSTGEGRFLVAWEEPAGIKARGVTASGAEPAGLIAPAGAAQVALATRGEREVHAAWAQPVGTVRAVHYARLRVRGSSAPVAGVVQRVDVSPPVADQAYPDVCALADGRVVVAWEDRRDGHTRLLFARQLDEAEFASPEPLNDLPAGAPPPFGRGPGAMRVSLATARAAQVVAVWLDKRAFLSGYGVRAAFSDDGGASFGVSELVQDSFGEAVPQWHATLAVGTGAPVVVAWDDTREDSADVWLSWRDGGDWSEDLALPGAIGAGEQTSPAIVLDEDGNLHAAWVEQAALDAPTRLRYVLGKAHRP